MYIHNCTCANMCSCGAFKVLHSCQNVPFTVTNNYGQPYTITSSRGCAHCQEYNQTFPVSQEAGHECTLPHTPHTHAQ